MGKLKKFWQWLLYGKPPTEHELHNVRYRGKTIQEFMAQETKETPEDRFRNFLSLKKKTTKFPKNGKNYTFGKIHPDAPDVEWIDKELNDADIDFKLKLEIQFERDYIGTKAVFKGNPTGLFKQWLKHKNLYNKYFDIKDKNDIEPTGVLTL